MGLKLIRPPLLFLFALYQSSLMHAWNFGCSNSSHDYPQKWWVYFKKWSVTSLQFHVWQSGFNCLLRLYQLEEFRFFTLTSFLYAFIDIEMSNGVIVTVPRVSATGSCYFILQTCANPQEFYWFYSTRRFKVLYVHIKNGHSNPPINNYYINIKLKHVISFKFNSFFSLCLHFFFYFYLNWYLYTEIEYLFMEGASS